MSILNGSCQTCMMCGASVEIKHVLTNIEILDTELDTRPRGVARLSEKNCVHYCENCGYASFDLQKDITFGRHEVLKSEEYLEIVHNVDLPNDAKKFYLVGLIMDEGQEFQRSATSFLRASWFFSDAGNIEWMVKSKERAIAEFLKSDFTWKNEQVLTILVDLYRRISKFDEALEAINKFGMDNVKDPLTKGILDFQIDLCKKQDTGVHTVSQVQI